MATGKPFTGGNRPHNTDLLSQESLPEGTQERELGIWEMYHLLAVPLSWLGYSNFPIIVAVW